MKPAYSTLDPEPLGLPAFVEVRHFMEISPKVDYLTYQIGEMVPRRMQLPVYSNKLVVDTKETNALVPVFHLMAWSRTLSGAVNMFKRNLSK